MEKVCRGKRPSEEQKQFLVSYLEDNLDLAHGRFQTVDGAKHREAEWRKLADQLNAIGGAFKDSTKWRKFWTDLRLHIKNNAQKIKENENRSGINGKRLRSFTDLEDRILKIINYRTVEGDRNTGDLGFEAIDENVINCTGEEEPEPLTLPEKTSTSSEKEPLPTVLPHLPTSTSCGRSRARRPTRRGRNNNEEVDAKKILSDEEKKNSLKEEENKFKKEELELRRLDLEEKRESNRLLSEILDSVRNRIN